MACADRMESSACLHFPIILSFAVDSSHEVLVHHHPVDARTAVHVILCEHGVLCLLVDDESVEGKAEVQLGVEVGKEGRDVRGVVVAGASEARARLPSSASPLLAGCSMAGDQNISHALRVCRS